MANESLATERDGPVITPQMIEAGADALVDLSSDDFTNFDRAKAAYVAMWEANQAERATQLAPQSF